MININFIFDLFSAKQKFYDKQIEVHNLKLKKIDNLLDFQYINSFDTSRIIGDSLFIVYIALEMLKARSSLGTKKLIYSERETIYKRSMFLKYISLYLPIMARLILVNQLYFMYFLYFVNRRPIEPNIKNN